MPTYTKRGYRKIARTMIRNKLPFGRQRKAGMKRPRVAIVDLRQNKRLRSLERMIETKEGTNKAQVNVGLPHNNTYLVQSATTGGVWNPFDRVNGTGDPMNGTPQMIGDQINVRGISVKGFFENALGRSKTYVRVMVLRGAKGDTFDRSTIFKGDTNNKMIDQLNVERFTLIASKTFTISASNTAASSVTAINGQPAEATNPPNGGAGTMIVKFWIPGRKFGRNGLVKYENQTSGQVKFYDYRMVIVAYDWYGTPQDLNNVAIINELYTKMYFKDP